MKSFSGLCPICQGDLDEDLSCPECIAVEVADKALDDFALDVGADLKTLDAGADLKTFEADLKTLDAALIVPFPNSPDDPIEEAETF